MPILEVKNKVWTYIENREVNNLNFIKKFLSEIGITGN